MKRNLLGGAKRGHAASRGHGSRELAEPALRGGITNHSSRWMLAIIATADRHETIHETSNHLQTETLRG